MTKKALLIGINYNGSPSQLNGCINDVKNIESLLKTYFKYTDFTILTDDTEVKPTRINIENAMKKFVDSSVAGDELYFHYSGHGSNISDTSGDESDRRDEVLVPLDYNISGLIVDDWIMTEFVCKVKQGVKLYSCMDCCHSGTLFDLTYNFRVDTTTSNEQLLLSFGKQYNINGSVWMFSGCQDPQTSADAFINRMAQGAFTFCFIDAIKSSLGKQIKLREMLYEVNKRLIVSGFKQRSQLSVGALSDCEVTFSL